MDDRPIGVFDSGLIAQTILIAALFPVGDVLEVEVYIE